jgi:hypothetical protein
MATDYNQIKNAAILTPTGNTDLGSDTNRYSNVYMSGNIVMADGVTVTSNNVITPKIALVTYPDDDTAADTAGGQTIVITGTGFSAGANVLVGSTPVSVVTVLSSTQITFISPAVSAGSYTLYVINSDGGTAIYIPGLSYSGTPAWTTGAGSLGSVYETNNINSIVTATGDVTVTYSLYSGTLPTGSSLNTSTGLISGTAPASAGSTTYSFVIRATDAQRQDTDRSFSITVNTDTVSWASPADNTSTSLDQGSEMSAFTMSASTPTGKSITYSADSLPTGLSISSNTIIGTPTVVGSSTTVVTATAATTGRTASRTFNWVVSVANEPYWMYTTLLLNAEGAAATSNAINNTFLDSGPNNYTITKTNSPSQGTVSPYSQSSWSNYFDGSSYLTVSSNTGLNLGSDAYTIEAWFNINALVGQQTIISFLGGLKITVVTTPGIRVWGNVAGGVYDTGTATITPGVWYHMAWVRESTSLGKLYLDGVLILTVTSGVTVSTMPSGQDVLIGYMGDSYANPFSGSISNLRVVKGTAVYTSPFTPPASQLPAISGTSLLTCRSNRFIDASVSTSTLTVSSGNPVVQKFSPFSGTAVYSPSIHGGSVHLKGANATTGDYLTATISPLGTGDFTIECWSYLEATGFINAGAVFSIFDGGTVQMLLRPENNVYWRLYYQTTSNTINQDTSPIVTNRWTHHAVVRISGTTKYYQDGILIGSVADSFNYTGTTLKVGSYADYNPKGFISDFRIVAGTGVYTGSFAPPTQALTAISGTRILLSFTNAGIIDQTGMHDIISIGDGSAKISTSVKKFNNGSLSWSGTGGWLEPKQTTNRLLRLGAGDWTFEFWLRLPNTSLSACWLINWNTDPRLNLDGQALAWMTAGTARITTGNVLTSNTWQHIAVVKYSGNTKIYVDGTQSGSTYADSNSYTVTDMDAIGYHPFVGYIDDFRLTKGYARYTATFTPPTKSFNLR